MIIDKNGKTIFGLKIRNEISKAINEQIVSFAEKHLEDGCYRVEISRPITVKNGKIAVKQFSLKADIIRRQR